MDEACSVIVSNLPEELAETVEVFLESTRKGGGKIKSFEFDKTKQSADVTFESSAGEFTRNVGCVFVCTLHHKYYTYCS